MKSIKKITSLAVIIAMMVLALPVVVNAFEGGDGTEDSPYQVSTPAQLDNVRNFLGAHFIQINDIDMTAATADGEGWMPIGDYSDGFSGTYDGSEYKIIGLRTDRTDTPFVGLFGYVDGGTITDCYNAGDISSDL